MDERDPSLDLALRLLGESAPPNPDEEARWAKRVSAKLAGAPRARREDLDALLLAPFPDTHADVESIEPLDDEIEELTPVREDPADGAAAADGYAAEERGWEGSISRPPGTLSRASDPGEAPSSKGGLEGSLARLARSGPNSVAPTSQREAAADVGKASGEDSGLIDLRGLGKPANDPPAASPPVASAPVAVEKDAPSVAAPSGKSAPEKTVAKKLDRPISGFIPPSAPPSTAAAQIASTRAPLPATQRTRGNGLWIALGGLAAAAAVAFFVIPKGSPVRQADRASDTAAKDPPAAAKKKVSPAEIVASAEPAPGPTDTTPTAAATESASATATVAVNDDVAPPTTASPTSYGIAKKPSSTVAPTVATNQPPTASTTVAASASPVSPKGTTSSLDDALGLNKPAPTTTSTATPIIDMPDKPDQGDIRSAVNAKLGAANACVKGLDGPSAVTITFSPAGTVSGVVVSSGPAKGTGAEACIKSVYSGAHVPRSKLGGYGYAQLNP